MKTQGNAQSKTLTKSQRIKRGIICAIVFVVCLVISASGILPESNTLGSKLAVIIVSIVRLLISIGFFGGLILGGYYLITGFLKKE
jgi:hypothetical protein